MRLTDELVAEVAMLQLPARLAKAFLRIMESKLEPRSQERVSTIQVSQRELGNLIGAARENVNKCLREWQRSGIVQVKDAGITVLNRGALKKVADEG